MRLTCPACGAATSLEAMTEDAAARRVAALFGELPPAVAKHVPGYLALFRPAKTGLRWTRTETVLAELVTMVREGFRRGRRRCKPSAECWQSALQEVASRDLRRPLKGHGYLMEVAAGLCERFEAVAEEQDIERKRAGEHRKSPRKATAIDAVYENFRRGFIDEAVRDRQIQRLKEISNGGG